MIIAGTRLLFATGLVGPAPRFNVATPGGACIPSVELSHRRTPVGRKRGNTAMNTARCFSDSLQSQPRLPNLYQKNAIHDSPRRRATRAMDSLFDGGGARRASMQSPLSSCCVQTIELAGGKATASGQVHCWQQQLCRGRNGLRQDRCAAATVSFLTI